MENNRKKSAVVFIGIPASGKSCYYQKYFSDSHVRINLDTLHTRNKERLLLEECFNDEKSFVVDNTNPTFADRERYIGPAKAQGYSIDGYFFQSVLKDCMLRNKEREGKARIPDSGIAAISNMLELPEMKEGFDHLFFVRMEKGEFITENYICGPEGK